MCPMSHLRAICAITGLEFFAMQKELEQILGCRVDLLTRRSVEQNDNPIRRRSILESAREVYAG